MCFLSFLSLTSLVLYLQLLFQKSEKHRKYAIFYVNLNPQNGPADKKLDVRSAQINVQLRATKESD